MVVRFDLFERLNTGGVALTNQEIRACIYRGQFNEFLEEMAGNKGFKKSVRLTQKQEKDGTREECVLRFFSFLYRYKVFEHSVVDFLNDYMKDASKSFNYTQGRKIFTDTFAQISRIFPKGIVRGPNRKITPINLFEGVSVGAALALKKKKELVGTGAEEWISSEELRQCTTGATNNREFVKRRVEYCRDKFLGK